MWVVSAARRHYCTSAAHEPQQAAAAGGGGVAHEGVLILPPVLGGLGLCFCQFFGGFLCFGVAAKRLLVCCHSCACSQ